MHETSISLDSTSLAVTFARLRTMMYQRSTVRAMLVILEQQGLVARDAHPTDGRARTVILTRSGLRKFQQVREAGQSVRDRMVSSLSTSETYLLLSLLAACFTITCGDFAGEGDRFQRKQNLRSVVCKV